MQNYKIIGLVTIYMVILLFFTNYNFHKGLNVYEKSVESTVKITIPQTVGTYVGSGTIISKINDRYFILTVEHSVSSQKNSMVWTNQNKYPYDIVYLNKEKDVAIISIVSQEKLEISSLKKRKYYLGDSIYIIGHPFGMNNTVTYGKISNTNQKVYMDYYIQTDASTNPGNSGGGLFDSNGDLIGMVQSIILPENATFRQSTGISLSISVNEIIDLIGEINE